MTTKSRELKIDLHQDAMNLLVKILGMTQGAAPVSQSITMNRVDVGDVQALEVARRVAFLLSTAGPAQEPAKTIQHESAKPDTKR